MNRYQIEVAEMDRRQRFVVRVLSLAGAGALIVVALWSAGLPPTVWFRTAHDWIARLRSEPVQQQSASTPSNAPTMSGPTESIKSNTASTALDGTESSTSPARLPLYLLSTSPGRNFLEGIAQIGTTKSNPQTYAAGALLANGAKLAEIHREFVILERDGQTTRLSLHPSATDSKAMSDLLLVGGPQKTHHLAVNTREILTDYLRPNPVFEDGFLRGYEVYPGQKSGVFMQMGLQPGDVITAIDGAPLTDIAQSMDMLRQLTEGIAVTATIKRKNASERITLDGALMLKDQERSDIPQSEQGPVGLAPSS